MIGDRKSVFLSLKSNKSKRLSKLENGERTSPYYRYCLAEVYIQWAFAHIKYKETLTAAYDFVKAYRLLEKNAKEYPDFIQDKKELGLLHILIGALPEEYRGITNVLNMHGDLKEGTEELEEVMNVSLEKPEYNYLKTESVFLLTFVYISFWNDKERFEKLEKIFTIVTNHGKDMSPFLTYAMTKLAIAEGNNDRAMELLMNRSRGKEYFPFSYLEYLTGLTKLNRLDEDANKYFQNFLLTQKGDNYIKAALQKLAWYSLIKGDSAKYKDYMIQIKDKGDNTIDDDLQAEKEAENGIIPNIYLLKGRLLCDGGYYEKAIDMINDKKAISSYKTSKDFLEYSYRLGRAYHEWDKIKQAIPYYELTIKNGSESEYDFAANSSLNLGYIYEKLHDYTKAKYFYKKCLEMKNMNTETV